MSFTLIECEACGRPIGSGRMCCPKCGAGQSVYTRITKRWEGVPENPVEVFYELWDEVKALLEIAEKVDHVNITEVFLEFHYTSIKPFVKKCITFSSYYRGWEKKDKCELWMIQCDERVRFIARESKDSDTIWVLEIDQWLINEMRNRSEEIRIEAERMEEAECRRRDEEVRATEERVRLIHEAQEKETQARIDLVTKLKKELETAYSVETFGWIRCILGKAPKEMDLDRFVVIKKTLKETDV